MKKLIASLVCACMLTSAGVLVGCADTGKTEETTTATTTTAAPEQNDDNSGSATEEDSGSASETEKPSTPEVGDSEGAKLYNEFVTQIDAGKDIAGTIEVLSSEDVSGYNCMSMEVSEGPLNGFDAEISGFKSGMVFSPVIGSIPFVGYVFETDDTEALKSTLLSHADPRWNICTEADETFCEAYGNYVFFVMLPLE